jgi:archaellum biogenesis ATPase FlaH
VTLLGPPGTGKSTLLQRTLYSTTEFGVSRYLAFLPGELGKLGRAEAGDFLNDLIVELRSQGFSGSRLRSDNLTGLRNELARQLKEASEVFKTTGRKAVIVIDGLITFLAKKRPTRAFSKSYRTPTLCLTELFLS